MPSGRTIRTRRQSRLAEQLAGILREARGARTRTSLAEAAGVVDATLGDLERGRANPTLAYAESVGELYGIELQLTSRRRRPRRGDDRARRGGDNGS